MIACLADNEQIVGDLLEMRNIKVNTKDNVSS
jgi:hypothetical protein